MPRRDRLAVDATGQIDLSDWYSASLGGHVCLAGTGREKVHGVILPLFPAVFGFDGCGKPNCSLGLSWA